MRTGPQPRLAADTGERGAKEHYGDPVRVSNG
ncbi:hypothetical protein JJ691_64920 [Kutzneria sp. CA-103260]|nr:hypothetical protein JJ691_64920 [Kutzneria sp. CA-103260]